MKAKFVYKGGKGSGNFGHSGIPGHQGGSKGTGGAGESTPGDYKIGDSTLKVAQTDSGWSYTVRHPDGYFTRDYTRTEEKALANGKAVAKLMNTPDGRAQLVVNNAFSTSYYTTKGLSYVRYKPYKDHVAMIDIDGKYGHISTSVKLDALQNMGFKDIKSFTDMIDKHGGGTAKGAKRSNAASSYYD